MDNFKYGSDLIGGSLMVREGRVIAELLLADATLQDWDLAIRVENRLQKRSPLSAKRNAQAIRKRLEILDRSFWIALRDGDDELSTQVSFCAALARNLLLVEFIETVIADTYAIHAEIVNSYQWMDFLDERTQRDPSIASWKESSRRKMKEVAFRMLAEAGYLKSTRSGVLQNVIVRPELRVLLEDNHLYRIKRCMEVSQKAA